MAQVRMTMQSLNVVVKNEVVDEHICEMLRIPTSDRFWGGNEYERSYDWKWLLIEFGDPTSVDQPKLMTNPKFIEFITNFDTPAWKVKVCVMIASHIDNFYDVELLG